MRVDGVMCGRWGSKVACGFPFLTHMLTVLDNPLPFLPFRRFLLHQRFELLPSPPELLLNGVTPKPPFPLASETVVIQAKAAPDTIITASPSSKSNDRRGCD